MVPGNFKLTAVDNEWPIIFDAGKFKAIYFWVNNGYANTATGVKAAPQQSLRVEVFDFNGKSMQVNDFLVGKGPKDTGTPLMWVNFKTPKDANVVHVSQGSKGSCDQRIAFVLV